MDPLTIAMLGGMGIKAAGAINQAIKAGKINPQRPTYEIPQGVIDSRNMFRAAAMSNRLPGQGAIEDNMRESQGRLLGDVYRSKETASNVLSALGGLSQQSIQGQRDLGVAGAQQRQQNMQQLSQEEGRLAQYQDQEFQFNEAEPYMQEVKRKNELRASSRGNLQNLGQDAFNFAALGMMGGGAGGMAGVMGGNNTTTVNPVNTGGSNTPTVNPVNTGGSNTTNKNPTTKLGQRPIDLSGISPLNIGYSNSIRNPNYGAIPKNFGQPRKK